MVSLNSQEYHPGSEMLNYLSKSNGRYTVVRQMRAGTDIFGGYSCILENLHETKDASPSNSSAAKEQPVKTQLEEVFISSRKIDYPRYDIRSSHFEIANTTTSAMKDLNNPTRLRWLRSFLDLEGLFRRFVWNFSRVAAHFEKKLRKDQSVQFQTLTAPEKDTVEQLKFLPAYPPVLAFQRAHEQPNHRYRRIRQSNEMRLTTEAIERNSATYSILLKDTGGIRKLISNNSQRVSGSRLISRFCSLLFPRENVYRQRGSRDTKVASHDDRSHLVSWPAGDYAF